MATALQANPATSPRPCPAVGVRFDRVYGKIVCYPVSTQALLLAELAQQKTLTPRVLEIARRMGMEISIQEDDRKMLEDFATGRL